MTDSAGSLISPHADLVECEACGWFHLLGHPCTRCERLGPPGAEPSHPAEPHETATETAIDAPVTNVPPLAGARVPEVRRIPQPGGRGALLAGGMPGNRGGGRKPGLIRAQIRELIALHGVDFLEAVLRRETVDFKVAKRIRREGAQAIQDDELIAVPVDTKTVLYALDLALRASEGM